jgi:sulfide:quinone oxidoreductase
MTIIAAALLAMTLQPQPDVVALTGEPDRAQIEAWRSQGVAKVITLQTPGELSGYSFDLADAVAGAGMIHAWAPTTGQSGPLTADQLAAVLADTPGDVVIHCRSGNRARHLYAAALIRSGQLAPEDYRSVDPDGDWNEDLLERYIGAELN